MAALRAATHAPLVERTTPPQGVGVVRFERTAAFRTVRLAVAACSAG